MNICPVKLAIEPQTVVKPEENYNKYALKAASVLPKDEILFGAGTSIAAYETAIRKAVGKEVRHLADCNILFMEMNEPFATKSAYVRSELTGVEPFSYTNLKEKNSHLFVKLMKKLVGKLEPEDNNERECIENIRKLSANGEIILKRVDDSIDLGDIVPLVRLRRNGLMNGVNKSKNFLIPENQYEIVFSTPKGGSEVIMGVTKNGEISVTQLSNMDIPKYTLFRPNGRMKIFTSGKYEDGNFVGKYFGPLSLPNPILSMLLR